MIMDDIDTAIVSISISNPTRFFVPDVSMMSLCVCVCVCVCTLVWQQENSAVSY